jgi:hypothetical protein
MTLTKSSTKHSKLSNKKTGTRETTHGQIGGDMLSNKKTGRRETNDGQPGGNKISNKKTETGITVDSLECFVDDFVWVILALYFPPFFWFLIIFLLALDLFFILIPLFVISS